MHSWTIYSIFILKYCILLRVLLNSLYLFACYIHICTEIAYEYIYIEFMHVFIARVYRVRHAYSVLK